MKVAFIGLGRMGYAMACRLLDHGHQVVARSRTAEKARQVVEKGAIGADSIKDAIEKADGVCITMLSDDQALRAVAMGPGGLLESLNIGGTHIVMGTHSVDLVRDLTELHARHGQVLIAAPVLGRPEAVVSGRLGIIVGGPGSMVDKSRPILESIGSRIFSAGEEPVAASAMKLANNMLLGCAIQAIAEAFVLVESLEGTRGVFRDIVTEGLFSCPAYKAYANLIADHNYDQVGFTAQLALKDVNLVLAAGESAAVPLPSASLCRDRLLSVMAHGDGQRDCAVLALEQSRAAGRA